MLACRTVICSVPKIQGKKTAGERVSSGLGNAGCGIQQLHLGRVPKTRQISLSCLISGEGAAIVHSPAKHLHFYIISIFQRKHIPPENFQWALIMCPDGNASRAKLHFSNFILSMHLNSPFSIWDLLLFVSWTRLWQSLYNTAVLFCPLKGFC